MARSGGSSNNKPTNRDRGDGSHRRDKRQRASRDQAMANVTAADFIPDIGDERASARKKAKSQFMAKAEMKVALPELPWSGKLLRYPGDPSRLYAFCASALESRVKMDTFCDRDLGIPIEAIDPDAYAVPEDASMHPEDMKLVEAAKRMLKTERTGPTSRRRESRSNLAADVTWLRRPEIMSTNLYSQKPSTGKLDSRGKRQDLQPRALVQSIEESFEHSKGDPKHRTQPHLEPVSVLPVYPAFDIGENKCSYVMFHQAPVECKKGGRGDLMINSILRNVPGENRSKDLFLPLPDASRSTDEVDWAGRYVETATTTVPDSKDRHFFLLTPSAAFYGRLDTRESLKRITNMGSLSAEDRSLIPRGLKLCRN